MPRSRKYKLNNLAKSMVDVPPNVMQLATCAMMKVIADHNDTPAKQKRIAAAYCEIVETELGIHMDFEKHEA